MPQITGPDGRIQVIPGVYTDIRVISSLPGPLPAFQIPVILAVADIGRPYNYDSVKLAQEGEAGPFQLMQTPTAVSDAFGPGSEIHTCMTYAQRHGLPFAFTAMLNELVRAEVNVESSGPVVEAKLYPRDFGVVPGHTKVEFIGAPTPAIKFTPVKRYTKILVAYAPAATRLYVREHGWMKVGQTITVGANTVTNEEVVIKSIGSEINATGQEDHFLELTTGITAGSALINEPLVLIYDENAIETITDVATSQEMFDKINAESKHMLVEKQGTFSGAALIVLAAVALKDIATWTGATGGSSPAATSTQVQSFVDLMNTRGWEDFALRYQLLPQAYLLGMPDQDSQIIMRDYALAERARGFPISVTQGGNWGEVLIDDPTPANDPLIRAAALNTQDTSWWAGGMDGIASYLSFAPAVFGLRVGGGVKHNLTNDELLYESLEVRWDEINSGELSRLHRGGVGSYRMAHFGAFRFVVSQGLSTLQNNSGLIWNEVTKETWSLTQRDLADFNDRVLKEDLNQSQLGADAVDARSIAAVLVRRAEKSLEKRGYIVPGSHKVLSVTVNEGGSGFDAVQTYKLPKLVDYITVTSNIMIGD